MFLDDQGGCINIEDLRPLVTTSHLYSSSLSLILFLDGLCGLSAFLFFDGLIFCQNGSFFTTVVHFWLFDAYTFAITYS
jgi:hypothetical protein